MYKGSSGGGNNANSSKSKVGKKGKSSATSTGAAPSLASLASSSSSSSSGGSGHNLKKATVGTQFQGSLRYVILGFRVCVFLRFDLLFCLRLVFLSMFGSLSRCAHNHEVYCVLCVCVHNFNPKICNPCSSLMVTLNATDPHYVRCIKPNDQKDSFQFHNG